MFDHEFALPNGQHADGPGAEQDRRAEVHRRKALHALAEGEPIESPIVHALLAIEARIDELVCYVAQLG